MIMNKKVVIFVEVFIIIICVLVGMAHKDKEIDLPEEISTILSNYNIKNTVIKELGKYNDKRAYIEDVEITKEEVEQYIDMELESYEELLPINDRDIVKKGDVVYVSYIVMHNQKVVNEAEHESLIVGAGVYDEQFEKALIGKKVAEPFEVTLCQSEDGIEYELNIIIESINYFKTYELTDTFVQEKMKMSTVDEYYKYCEERIREEKYEQMLVTAQRNLYLSIIDECEFYVDMEEISQYSTYIVEQEKQIAYIYDMQFEQYVKEIKGQEIDEFYQECYEYGKYTVERYLVVGALFSDLNYEITDSDYRLMCAEKRYEYEEAKSDIYVNANICYSIMEKKVWEYFLYN